MLGSAQCRSMAERIAAMAVEPSRSARERAVLEHLFQSWAAVAWATELVEKHGVDIAPFQPPDNVNTSGLSACSDMTKV